ncbi:5-oxoprolinase subunit PxpB [Rasiella sp. SM2506]|uniref:5-oxoprolinase subunit PxpB n=1 Tax=Rasiella sp. SM2506 TaxID=3423914 RepID=UPI003D79398A
MKAPKLFKPSPKTLLLQWDSVISEEIQQAIRHTEALLRHHFSNEILEITPTYTELAVYCKKDITISAFEKKFVEVFQKKSKNEHTTSSRLVTIPVCYDAFFGLDLAEVALYHKLTSEEIIELHTQSLYTVSFIGFLPGFPYLTGLSEKLYTPRKQTPRQHIPKGSVGIGGKQTGVYPSNSPGGWNIIGRSSLPFFSVEKERPSLLLAGDCLQFQSISKDEFNLISLEIASGVYQLKTQAL